MSISKQGCPSGGSEERAITPRTTSETECLLGAEDRVAIERLLRNRGTRHAPNPLLLNGLLSRKLRSARAAPVPAPADLVVGGSHVTYMISGEGARSGTLAMGANPVPGHILVASLLGATLIGMRRMQKAPLPRDDGRVDVVVVLDVRPPSGDEVA